MKKSLKQFLHSHVNVLQHAEEDENTQLFNLLQHLFTIEKEQEIYKSYKGNNRILEEFFEKPYESYASFNEFYSDFESILIGVNAHDCSKG
jgi:hypothetical protein